VLSGESLSAIEVATGGPWGDSDRRADVAPDDRPPSRALEDATLEGLRAPGATCVAFSGGRDSALVLAAAAAAARRHGLTPPVAVTLRLPDVPLSHEDEWQERVIAHVEIDDWVRLEVGTDLDLAGPIATPVLARHGPYWPANAHFFVPMLRATDGGTLLTGDGGDEIFGIWHWRAAADVLARRSPFRPGSLKTLAAAFAPPTVRRRRAAHPSRSRELPWLTPEGQRAYARLAAGSAEAPVRWDRHLAWMAARRSIVLATATYETLAADEGATISAPLLAPAFLGSLARAGGRLGIGNRTQTLEALFGELLPPDVLRRATKATFNEAFFGPRSRELIEAWDGHGVDRRLVDPQALRNTWLAPRVHWQSSDLFQHVILQSP
jgi:asparagine synthase (glutamine-hydrolysing)